jgi:predicted SprT family Zn-dependent metalloprotease
MHDKLVKIQVLALQLMADWHLHSPEWRFRWNRRKRAMGRCVFPRVGISAGIIELSQGFVLGNNGEDLVRDTILHEIAHALAGSTAGHGPEWKEWCRRVGANPERIGVGADMPTGSWQATCPKCSTLYSLFRRPKHLGLPVYFCSVPACGKRMQQLDFRHCDG